MNVRAARKLLVTMLAAGAAFLAGPAPLRAQPRERPQTREEYELRLQELESRMASMEKNRSKAQDPAHNKDFLDAVKDAYAKGVLTIGGAEFRLGGKLEINFVDTEAERDPVLGTTDNPDPHLEFDRLRLEPELDIGKNLGVRGQLDFRPDQGDTILKEMVAFHDWKHEWWFRTEAQIGLDDRFIHVGPTARVSETYALIGTAFWRDEEIALMWKGTIGNKRGAPPETVAKKKKPASGQKQPRPRNPAEEPAEEAAEEVNGRESQTSSTEHQPFDFAGNPGALVLHFSLGDGHTEGTKEIGKDQADLQEVLQDDRNLKTGLSLRELGFGVGYERDFNYLGELEILGFFFDDQLNQDSINFFQDDLTLRNLAGNPVAGYGNSNKEYKRRIGISAGYHLEGYHIFKQLFDVDTHKGDGLYVQFQYIDAKDGDLDRDGYYIQGSYRFSFPRPLIADNYIRDFELVGRYGNIKVRMDPVPSLPATWDRRQILVGGVLSVTRRVLLKAEYAFNTESTGLGQVDNNELIVQLLVNF